MKEINDKIVQGYIDRARQIYKDRTLEGTEILFSDVIALAKMIQLEEHFRVERYEIKD